MRGVGQPMGSSNKPWQDQILSGRRIPIRAKDDSTGSVRFGFTQVVKLPAGGFLAGKGKEEK